MIAVLLLVAALGVGAAYWQVRTKRIAEESQAPASQAGVSAQPLQHDMGMWEQALATEKSELGRTFIRMGRPLVDREVVAALARSKELSWLQRKLLAAGAPYGGSVEVFIATQVVTIMVGFGLVLFGYLAGDALPILPNWVLPLGGVAIMFWPYARVHDAANKRADRILRDLPDFVDLLLIPIVAGSGIVRSLRDTAARFTGPVANEVNNAVAMIEVGRDIEEALWYAGHRLAVQEARIFFATLAQAQSQGSSVREVLEQQRDILRVEAFQRQRAMVKKIPARVVVVMIMHFMPILFALALIPLVANLGVLAGG